MTYTTLTIGSSTYVSYASVAEADVILGIDPTRGTAWTALDNDAKEKNLVAATNRLDLLDWLGQRADGGTQENAWPRSGLKYEDGSEVPAEDDDEDPFVPNRIERATILLAGSIAISVTHAEAGGGGPDQRRITKVKAGSAEVSFAAPATTTGPDPSAHQALGDQTVLALVQLWLRKPATAGSASSLSGGAEYFGSDIDDPFDPDFSPGEGFA